MLKKLHGFLSSLTIILAGLLILTACQTLDGGGEEPPSIGEITLSGTLNVTYDGQVVPRVEISVSSEDGYSNDLRTQLTSPDVNASWSITLPAFDSPTPISFNIIGYSANGDTLFDETYQPNPQVYASNQNISNISLNLGNIANPNTPVNPTPLTANTWKDDSITNSGDEKWYSISVTGGTTYYLWWNDADGDGSKTLGIDVYAYNSSGSQIILGGNDSAWYDPVSFTASSTGAVYVRVCASSGNNNSTGTYAIVYSTSGIKPASPCTITFSSNGGSGTVPSPITAYSGNSITLPSGSELSYDSGYIFGGWTDYYGYYTYSAGSSYTVYDNTTLYAKWINNALGGEGNPIPLTANTWTDGSIDSNTPDGEVWYSFNATNGFYHIWWNDYYEGNGTKTLDVQVTCYNTTGLFEFIKNDSGWLYDYQIRVDSAGTVKLKVEPYSYGGTGTYAIAYNTSGIRP